MDSSDSLDRFGFDSDVDAWFEYLRQAPGEAPIASIGPYELTGKICRGGQGIVYQARRRNETRLLAVKRPIGGERASLAARRRFEREVRATRSLSHPSIVPIRGVEWVRGEPLLEMPWVDGLTFDLWAARVDRDPARVVEEMIQVCRALEYAHEKGLLHRDLKPQNILVDEGGPHLLDFGLAHFHSDEGGSLSSRFLGTPAYAAPEILQGGRATQRSEVYSLSVMLMEALSGRRSVSGDELSPRLRALEERDPRLARVVGYGLKPDATERWSSFVDFRAALEAWARGTPIAFPSGSRPRRRWRAALSLAAIGVVAGLVWGAWGSRPPAEETPGSLEQLIASNLRLQRTLSEVHAAESGDSALDLDQASSRFEQLRIQAQSDLERRALKDAEEHYRHALPLLEAAGMAETNAYATTLRDLAHVLGVRGWVEEAEGFLRRALEVLEKTVGTEHPEFGDTLVRLGLTLVDQRRYEEARLSLTAAQRVLGKSLGPAQADTVQAAHRLIELLILMGDGDNADALLEETRGATEEWLQGATLGRREIGIACRVALTYEQRFLTDRAAPLWEMLRERIDPAQGQFTGLVDRARAIAALESGDCATAMALGRSRDFLAGGTHEVAARLALTCEKDLAEAERLALRDLIRLVGEKNIGLRATRALTLLARVALEGGRTSEAHRLGSQALSNLEDGPPGIVRIELFTVLARTHALRGEARLARDFAQRAVRAAGDHYGPDHPARGRTIREVEDLL